jgi:hypothetical protein
MAALPTVSTAPAGGAAPADSAIADAYHPSVDELAGLLSRRTPTETFYRLWAAPAVSAPVTAGTGTLTLDSAKAFRLPQGALQSKSCGIGVTPLPAPEITAFGGGEFRSIYFNAADAAQLEVGVTGSVDYFGAFKALAPRPRLAGRITRVCTRDELRAAAENNAPAVKFPEPAISPANAGVKDTFKALFPEEFNSDFVTRIDLHAASRFFASDSFGAPTYAGVIEVKARTAIGRGMFGIFISAGGTGDSYRGIGGFALPSKTATDEEREATVGSGGVAASTMHGDGSLFAAADHYQNVVHIYSFARKRLPQSPDTTNPPETRSDCVRTLVARIPIPGERCMISPNAVSDFCGVVVVCSGGVKDGALEERREFPLLTRAGVYVKRKRHSASDPVAYEKRGAPFDVPVGRVILQAGITRTANVIGVVSCLEDLVSNMRLDLCYESLAFVQSDAATSPSTATRAWTVGQTIHFDPSVTHPIALTVASAPLPEEDDGRTITFCGFNLYATSDSARYISYLYSVADIPQTPHRAWRVITSGFEEAAPPPPPPSVRFNAEGAEESLMPYFNVDPIPSAVRNYIIAYAGYVRGRGRGGLRGGAWRPFFSPNDEASLVLLHDRDSAQCIGLDVSSSGLVASVRVRYASGIADTVADTRGAATGALQGWVRSATSDSVTYRTFTEVPPGAIPDVPGNRGPTPHVEERGSGTPDPGDAFISQFVYFRRLRDAA